jgi:hypothetical protein
MILSRRRALLGLLAAPAIVAAPSLMRVSAAVVPLNESFSELVIRTMREHPTPLLSIVNETNALYANMRRYGWVAPGINRDPSPYWRAAR